MPHYLHVIMIHTNNYHGSSLRSFVISKLSLCLSDSLTLCLSLCLSLTLPPPSALPLPAIAPRLQYAVIPERFANVPREQQGGQGSGAQAWSDLTGGATEGAESRQQWAQSQNSDPRNFTAVTWRPPFRDAADVVIDKIRSRQTVQPIDGKYNIG